MLSAAAARLLSFVVIGHGLTYVRLADVSNEPQALHP